MYYRPNQTFLSYPRWYSGKVFHLRIKFNRERLNPCQGGFPELWDFLSMGLHRTGKHTALFDRITIGLITLIFFYRMGKTPKWNHEIFLRLNYHNLQMNKSNPHGGQFTCGAAPLVTNCTVQDLYVSHLKLQRGAYPVFHSQPHSLTDGIATYHSLRHCLRISRIYCHLTKQLRLKINNVFTPGRPITSRPSDVNKPTTKGQ